MIPEEYRTSTLATNLHFWPLATQKDYHYHPLLLSPTLQLYSQVTGPAHNHPDSIIESQFFSFPNNRTQKYRRIYWHVFLAFDLLETICIIYSSGIIFRLFYRRLNGSFKRCLPAENLKYGRIFLRFCSAHPCASPPSGAVAKICSRQIFVRHIPVPHPLRGLSRKFVPDKFFSVTIVYISSFMLDLKSAK